MAANRSSPEVLAQPYSGGRLFWTSLRIALAAAFACGADHDAAVECRELRQRQQLFAGQTLNPRVDVDPRWGSCWRQASFAAFNNSVGLLNPPTAS